MPSADELISDLDEQFHASQPPQSQPELETYKNPAPSGKKSKKGKAKKNAAAQARRQLDDDEDSPYAKSVTPSPPTQHGVRLERAPSRPPIQEPEPEPEPDAYPEPEREPEPRPQEVEGLDDNLLNVPVDETAWDNEQPAVMDTEPPQKPQVPSPAVRSPRPPPAKQHSPAFSPPYRPPGFYGSPSSPYSPPMLGLAEQHQAPQTRAPSLTPQQTSPRPRYTPLAPPPGFMDPPPPHMPQKHFYQVPELSFPFGSQKPEQGKPAGADGYCCRFDTFADAADFASGKKARDALLIGSDCGLECYRVLPDKLEVVGRIEGLRGAVIDAKVLPHTEVYDMVHFELRPMILITVHGPMSDDRRDSGNEDEVPVPEHKGLYQTTVELYSLKHQLHMATLYKSTVVKMEQPVVGHIALPPGPVGDLSLDAAGRYVTIASGKSGEVLVFSSLPEDGFEEPVFRCIGKFWTAVQQRNEPTRPAGSSDASSTVDDTERQRRQPVFSLSNRWLAIVPPYTSANMSIQGSPALVDSSPNPPGLSSHVAPPQPPLTCEIAGLDPEDTWGWLSRKAAQELVKATRKTYEMGANGWRELTQPAPPPESQHPRMTSQDPVLFPPTNAPADDPKRLAKEPALVSVVDLQRLLPTEAQSSVKQLPSIISTVALVEGCNHLSFSPDGLKLLTLSRKGEVTTIWDLAHLAHGSAKAKGSADEEAELRNGPHILYFHGITRSSPSIAIDCVWSRDGDWLAMLTAHGTIHLHEIPLTAASKKRKRRGTVSAPPVPDKAEATVSVSQPGMSPPSSNGFLGNWRSWSQSVSTQVTAMKSQNTIPTTFAGFRETAAAAAVAGRKAVGKGLNTTYSAAKSSASNAWHAEDNKIRPKPFAESVSAVQPFCLRWVERQSGSALAVTCGGNVYLYPVQRVTRKKGEVLVSGLKKDKHHKTFPLPRITTNRNSAAKTDKCRDQGPHGFWILGTIFPPDALHTSARRGSVPSAANEVETNPPYCPFHIDSRVGIYAFDDAGHDSQAALYGHSDDPAMLAFRTQGHGCQDDEPWVFGEPLPPSSKVNERVESDVDGAAELDYGGRAEDDDDDDEGVAAQVESRLTLESVGDRGEQQIRVKSRRSRRVRGSAGAGGEGEGGFDVLEEAG